jgi:hypothetical protein
MPTVLREKGFRVRIHGPPREHPPPHVHVEKRGGGLVVILLATPLAPQVVWEASGMKPRDILKAFRLVEKHRALLEETWRQIHGLAQLDR